LKAPLSKAEQPTGEHGRWVGSPKSCEVAGCDRLAHARGMCSKHYRAAMHRERGLKRGGRFKDLTGMRFGVNGSLFVEHEAFPDNDRTKHWSDGKARWAVIHDIGRGGCGEFRIALTESVKAGQCICQKSKRFKAQTLRKAQGEKGRLFPLTEKGRAAISESNRRRNVIAPLPRTLDGKVMKRSNKRGKGTGRGRKRKYQGTATQRNAAAQRAWRAKHRERRAAQLLLRAELEGHLSNF